MLDPKRDWRRIIKAAKELKVAGPWLEMGNTSDFSLYLVLWARRILWPERNSDVAVISREATSGFLLIVGPSHRRVFTTLEEAKVSVDKRLTEDGWILATLEDLDE